jgi:hypothetical protein
MLHGEPADWAQYLPGYGAYRALIDGGLTPGFDAAWALSSLWTGSRCSPPGHPLMRRSLPTGVAKRAGPGRIGARLH